MKGFIDDAKWLKDVFGYTIWDYAMGQGYDIGGFWSYWMLFRHWWSLRPQRAYCASCKQPLWHMGEQETDIYCSKGCYTHGPYNRSCPDCGLPEDEGDHTGCVPF